ncbi:MAG: divergent polysaccharide deacetylase family protein [Candidatus Eisenbacteria bacterium]
MARKRSTPRWSRLIAALFGAALVLFAAGEAVLMTRTDTGRIRFARTFGFVDQPELTRLVGRQVRRALVAAGIPADSVTERSLEDGAVAVRWTAGLGDGASLLQANYTITRTLEEAGAEVLSGRESHTPQGTTRVTLIVGLPHRPTHELMLIQGPRREEPLERRPTRVALVLYGFGDAASAADSVFAMPEPFAVALLAGGPNSAALFRAAHRRQREVVMLLPLEPVNYPQVNPGPGTLLVTMKPARVAGTVDRYLDQAGAVTAVANHMGSLATQDMTVMTAVYRTLRQHHLPFVHLMPAAGAVCKPLASDMGVAYEEPGAVLDSEPRARDPRVLERRWKTLIDEARARGELTVWIRLTPQSRRWLEHALDRKKMPGVDLVPLASLIRRPPPV